MLATPSPKTRHPERAALSKWTTVPTAEGGSKRLLRVDQTLNPRISGSMTLWLVGALDLTLRLQITQCRIFLYTLGPTVGILSGPEALGLLFSSSFKGAMSLAVVAIG